MMSRVVDRFLDELELWIPLGLFGAFLGLLFGGAVDFDSKEMDEWRARCAAITVEVEAAPDLLALEKARFAWKRERCG